MSSSVAVMQEVDRTWSSQRHGDGKQNTAASRLGNGRRRGNSGSGSVLKHLLQQVHILECSSRAGKRSDGRRHGSCRAANGDEEIRSMKPCKDRS